MKRGTIYYDLRENWLFLSILFLGCIPHFIKGYGLYFIVLLFFYMLIKYKIRLTAGLILSFLFGAAYTLPLIFHDSPPSLSTNIFTFLYPSIFYLIPVYLSSSFKNRNSIFVVTFILVCCIASWSIIENILDFIKTGKIINISRTLGISGNNSENFTSPTLHNVMLSLAMGGIGMIFVKPHSTIETKIKPYLIIIGIISFFASIHLLNRTSLFLVFFAIFIPFFLNFKVSKNNLIKLLLIILLFVFLVLTLTDNSYFQIIIDGFKQREKYNSYTLSTGGGRDVLMKAGIEQILENPFGRDALFYHRMSTYAHNFILDSGIQAGWIAMIILLIITMKYILSSYKAYILNKRLSVFWRSYMAILTVMILLQFSVEPIIQASIQVFCMLFYLWSLSEIIDRNYIKIKNQ